MEVMWLDEFGKLAEAKKTISTCIMNDYNREYVYSMLGNRRPEEKFDVPYRQGRLQAVVA